MNNSSKLAIATTLLLILFLFFNPIVLIGPGERGVVTHFGAVESTPLSEGIHVRSEERRVGKEC